MASAACRRGDGSNRSDGMAGRQGVRDKLQESAGGAARNHVKRNEIVLESHEILGVGVEDAEVVLGAVVAAFGDLFKAQPGKPSVDFGLGDRDDVESRLRGGDGGIVALVENAFEAIQSRDQLILEVEPFEVFERGGFPEVEASGVLIGGDQGEIDSGSKAEDAVAGDFEIPVGRFVVKQVVLLSAANDLGGKVAWIQQQTQTSCPFTKAFFLPGESGRPRCCDI